MNTQSVFPRTIHDNAITTMRPTTTQRILSVFFAAPLLILALIGILSFPLVIDLSVCSLYNQPTYPVAGTSTLVPRFLPPNANVPLAHGRCNVHAYEEPEHFKDWNAAGHIWVRITDASNREIGHLDWSDWNDYIGQNQFNITTRVGTLEVAPTVPYGLDFSFGQDAWQSGDDGRCRVGGWDRVVLFGWDLRRANRQMDCGFAC